MMENYAEASVEYANATGKGLSEIREVQIEESTSELSVLAGAIVDARFEGNKQKFAFGAEFVKTSIQTPAKEEEQQQQQNHCQHPVMAVALPKHAEEVEIKTNLTKIITSTTTTITSGLSGREIDVERTIETPLSVSELSIENINTQVQSGDNNDPDQDQDQIDEEEPEGENDSYRSEEDTKTNHAVTHTSSHSHSHSHTMIADHQESEDAVSQDSADESTSDSDFSDLSGLSDMSGREWKPISARPINWVQKQMHSGVNPRELLSQMLPSSAHQIAPGLTDMTLWRILASLISEPPRRHKLRHINTFEDVVQLVLQSQNIMVLTGAGVSVSCGIPDFRSSDGIYSRLAKDYPDLPDPQAMFDINYFSRDPRPFFKFAKEIYPGQFKPSPCHRFIKLLEEKGKLLRNYTQNIDTLEQVAGIEHVIECHGSFSTASCTKCRYKCNADAIRQDIFAQRIPVCPRCQPNVQQSVDASEPVSELELKQLVENGIMKPDIVFFGEGLPQEFHTVMASDKDKCDLLIVMGSSLKVRPVALIPSSIPSQVPQILINREQLHHLEFDVELLGDSDVIINQLCHHLGADWKQICFDGDVLTESKELMPLDDDEEESEDSTLNTEREENSPPLQDTDTQSVKSNASTDVAMQSAGAYSDSGFESSTSSAAGIVGKSSVKSITVTTAPQAKCNNLLPPELDEPTDAMDGAVGDFQPFSERLGQMQKTNAYGQNYRHLSIDSSKDSGIQCDSSNSALATNGSGSAAALLPPITCFGDTGGTKAGVSAENTSASQQISTICDSPPLTAADANSKTAMSVASAAERSAKRRMQKRQSAAERLVEGTYYCHESSASYVFPGAQVSWYSEEEEEEEGDDGEGEGEEEEEEEDEDEAEEVDAEEEEDEDEQEESGAQETTTAREVTNTITTKFTKAPNRNKRHLSEPSAASELQTCTATATTTVSCATISHKSNNKETIQYASATISSSQTSEVHDCAPLAKRRRETTSALYTSNCDSGSGRGHGRDSSAILQQQF